MSTSGFTSPRFRFSDPDEAQEYFYSQGMTDGLPVVVPTEDKVTAMLKTVGLNPGDVIAREGVRGVSFTAEKVAINAVMAGCKPEYMPVVVAADKRAGRQGAGDQLRHCGFGVRRSSQRHYRQGAGADQDKRLRLGASPDGQEHLRSPRPVLVLLR